MFTKRVRTAREGLSGLLTGERVPVAGPESAEAMPQRMESYRRSCGERARRRDLAEMESLGWTVERVRFTPRGRLFGLFDRPRSRVADVHYLRQGGAPRGPGR